AKAAWWNLQVVKLSRPLKGMPVHQVQQLYNMVVVLTITYVANVWFTAVHDSLLGAERLGSIVATKKLAPSQRQVAKLITDNKEDALALATLMLQTAPAAMYCNGSRYEEGIGALAVLFVDSREQWLACYYFGPNTKYMVYEAEIYSLPSTYSLK
ncbi:hypothetical protein J132_07395, partial [Termitomyces sp. J132]